MALAVLAVLLVAGPSAWGAAGVVLAWDPSPSPQVVGYKLHWGGASGAYTGVLDVGNTNTVTVTNLTIDVLTFFAVTAYDSNGVESLPSNEISYTLPAPPTVPTAAGLSWSNPADLVYGTPLGPQQLNATASVPGGFVYNPPPGAVLAAGPAQTLTVIFTPADLTSFSPATNTVLVNVQPAPLRITADSKSKTYGGAMPLLTFTPAGFVNGDTAAVLAAPPALSTTAGPASGVGTYPISVTGAAAPNYTISFGSGVLTVTPAPLRLTADNQTKAYGTALPLLTFTPAGFVNGDTVASLSTPPSLSTSATAGSAVGSYPITLTGAASPNYTISLANGTLTVTPATLRITAENATKVYGQALPVLASSIVGFANGDSLAILSGPVHLDTTASASSAVGAYPITPSGPTAPNYSITFVPGTLTVTPAPLRVTADDKSMAYGQVPPPLTASFAGLVNGDTPASLGTPPQPTTTASATSPVGTYPISVSGVSAPNYTVAFGNGTLTVNPATLTVTANDLSRPKGATNPPLTATYAGFVNGETPAVLSPAATLQTTADTNSPVGAYPITVSGGAAPNYQLSVVNGTLTVTAAALTALALSPTNLALYLGQTQAVSALEVYTDGSQVTQTEAVVWGVARTNVASIQTNGVVTALAAGQTLIGARVGPLSASGLVTVTVPPASQAQALPPAPPALGGTNTTSPTAAAGATTPASSASSAGSTTPAKTPSPSVSLPGVPPLLAITFTNQHATVVLLGTVGASYALQSSSRPGVPGSWITLTNLTLDSPVHLSAVTPPPGVLGSAFVPAAQAWTDPRVTEGAMNYYRVIMQADYATLADQVLGGKGYATRLIVVRMPGDLSHVVCYVTQANAYLDYDSQSRAVRLQPSGAAIREVATMVAAAFNQNWTSASEFTVSDGVQLMAATVVKTDPPSADPVAAPGGPAIRVDF